jgi:hypothetical protein
VEYDSTDLKKVMGLMDSSYGETHIAAALGVTRHKARRMMQETEQRLVQVMYEGDEMEATGICQARSLEALLDLMDVDLDTWFVRKWVGNQWGNGNLWQIKAFFERRTPEERASASLIEDLRQNPIKLPPPCYDVKNEHAGRVLEISIADPHYGMRCFAGPSGENWSPEDAEHAWWQAYEHLTHRGAALSGQTLSDCVLVFGNDFLHADNVFHTTTQGTGQPEMDSWHEMVRRGKRLLIETVARAAGEFRNVYVLFIPGNHARQTEYMLGLIVEEAFKGVPRVTVNADPSPYKFMRFGCNLIGYDHGHSINPTRLGGLMAEERKQDWAETTYREWHLGDQHRKGVSRPTMEEMGVSIEYLPSLIPHNEWHKIKGFSHQKRAACGFVYDEHEGCIAKIQYNHPS